MSSKRYESFWQLTLLLRRVMFVIVTLGMSISTQAQVGALGADITGRDLLNKANRILTDRIYQGGAVANGLLNQALTGVSVLAESARLAGNDVAGKSLDKMQGQEAQVFLQLKELVDAVTAGGDKIYSLQEVTNLDVSAQLSAIPFLKNQVYVSSVKGLSVKDWQTTSHPLTIVGTGLGPGESDAATEVLFTMHSSGKAVLPDGPPNRTQNYTNTYSFKKTTLRGDAPVTKITSIPIDVTMTRTQKRRFLSDVVQKVKFPIVLTIYPEEAGGGIVNYDAPTFSYVIADTKTEKFPTRDCGEMRCGGGGQTEQKTTTAVASGSIASPPEGNRKVANPRIACAPYWDPNNCSYIYDLKASVSADERQVNAEYRTTSSEARILVSYDILEWRRGAPAHGSFPVKLNYGKLLMFCVPPGVLGGTLDVKLNTGATYQVSLGASIQGLLSGSPPIPCANGGLQFSYSVIAPN